MRENPWLGLGHSTVHQVQPGIPALSHGVIVSDNDKGLPFAVAQFNEELEQRIGVSGIEVAGGFIGQYHVGFIHERPGCSDALLFPTAELVGEVMKAAP